MRRNQSVAVSFTSARLVLPFRVELDLCRQMFPLRKASGISQISSVKQPKLLYRWQIITTWAIYIEKITNKKKYPYSCVCVCVKVFFQARTPPAVGLRSLSRLIKLNSTSSIEQRLSVLLNNGNSQGDSGNTRDYSIWIMLGFEDPVLHSEKCYTTLGNFPPFIDPDHPPRKKSPFSTIRTQPFVHSVSHRWVVMRNEY